MQDLDQILAYLVNHVDGALSAAVGGMDGLLIEQYSADERDLTAVAAEQTSLLSFSQAAYSKALEGGDLKEVIVSADEVVGYTRLLGDDLFCLVVLSASGNLGKARLYSDQVSGVIREVLL